jgi:hypothetical protein
MTRPAGELDLLQRAGSAPFQAHTPVHTTRILQVLT